MADKTASAHIIKGLLGKVTLVLSLILRMNRLSQVTTFLNKPMVLGIKTLKYLAIQLVLVWLINGRTQKNTY